MIATCANRATASVSENDAEPQDGFHPLAAAIHDRDRDRCLVRTLLSIHVAAGVLLSAPLSAFPDSKVFLCRMFSNGAII
jgi:hypothetical protein